jgi:hypothetical protein
MKTIVAILVIIFSLNIAVGASFRPEDTYRSAFWLSLSPESKNAFLRGVSCGAIMQCRGNQKAPLVIGSENIPPVIDLLNTFYSHSENKHVYVGLAVEICLMQFYKKSDQEITSAIAEARRLSSSSD